MILSGVEAKHKTSRRRIAPITVSIILFAIMALTFVVTPGCTTTGGGGGNTPAREVDWKRLEPIFEVAAFTGTSLYLKEHPQDKPTFEGVVGILDALIVDPYVDPAKLSQALQKLPIKELNDSTGAIIVGSTIILWEGYKAKLPVGVEAQASVIRPLVVRVRNGIGVALGLPPVAPPLGELQQRMSLSHEQLKLHRGR